MNNRILACGVGSSLAYWTTDATTISITLRRPSSVPIDPSLNWLRAGGFGICVVPSLDLVIYKMAGDDRQYDPKLTGIPQDYRYDGSRDHWEPAARSQFSDGPIGTDDGLRRVIEMVAAAVVR